MLYNTNMKILAVFFLSFLYAVTWAADAPTQQPAQQPAQPSTFTVTAPEEISFLGRHYYFSHWECEDVPHEGSFISSICSTQNTLLVDLTKPSAKNYKGVPLLHVYYLTKKPQQIRPLSELVKNVEFVSFSTDGHANPTAFIKSIDAHNHTETTLFPCGKDVITVQWGFFTKFTRNGSFGVTFGKNQFIPDKKIKTYVQRLCKEPFPVWLKDFMKPKTAEETAEGANAAKPTPKPAPVKKTTVIPVLQKVPSPFRSGK